MRQRKAKHRPKPPLYQGRIQGSGMPWVVCTPEEAAELRQRYGELEVVLIPTEEGVMEIRRITE